MTNTRQLTILLVLVLFAQTLSGGHLPICGFTPDATIQCKTQPKLEFLVKDIHCPMGQTPTTKELLSEPWEDNKNIKQYYWICKPIERCRVQSRSLCRTGFANSEDKIKPPSFRKQLFISIGNAISTANDKYYRIYKHMTCDVSSEARSGVKKGMQNCRTALNHEQCVTNCAKVPKDCVKYDGNRFEISHFGLIHDDIKKCNCYICGIGTRREIEKNEHYVHGKVQEEGNEGLKECDIAHADDGCVTNCADPKKAEIITNCEEYEGNRPTLPYGVIRDEDKQCDYYKCGPRATKTDMVDRHEVRTSSWSENENWILVGMSVASLLMFYGCFCVVMGASLGYWVGNNVKKPIVAEQLEYISS